MTVPPHALVRALRLVNRIPDVELCIVGRGGGGKEDLAAFNTRGGLPRTRGGPGADHLRRRPRDRHLAHRPRRRPARRRRRRRRRSMAVADRREVLRQLDDLAARLAARARRRARVSPTSVSPAPPTGSMAGMRRRAPARAAPAGAARRAARRAEPAPRARPRLRRAGGCRRSRAQARGGLRARMRPSDCAWPTATFPRGWSPRDRIADELARLEEIVRRLEADDVELDAALALFEEGRGATPRRPRATRRRGAQGPDRARGGGGDLRLHRSRWLRRPPRRSSDLLAEARDRTDRLLGRVGRPASRRGAAGARATRSPTRCATPGKRVRAALVLAAYRAVGGRSPAIAGVARRGRDGAHLLPRARRPPLHGRRRPAPRPSHHPPALRRSHRDPRRLPARPGRRRGCSPRPRTISSFRRPPWAGWRSSCSRPAASRGWWAGSGWTSRRKADSSPSRT